jgi:hypothetical protein
MPSSDPSDFDMLAASLRVNTEDAATYLVYLATKMTAALPAHTKIERKGIFKNGPPRKVAVELGERTYIVEEQRGALVASRHHVVRNVEISREPMEFDRWSAALVESLGQMAERSAAHRDALEKLTLG